MTSLLNVFSWTYAGKDLLKDVAHTSFFFSLSCCCSWWTCSSATATSGGTSFCNTSSSSSTSRVRSSLRGKQCHRPFLYDFFFFFNRNHQLLSKFLLLLPSCSSSCVLNDDQSAWIEETTKLVYQVGTKTTFKKLYLWQCNLLLCFSLFHLSWWLHLLRSVLDFICLFPCD